MSHDVTIDRLAFGGEGVGRLEDGRVVFVRNAFPGERVKVRLLEDKRSFARGEVIEHLELHPERSKPDCVHAPACGGCQFWSVPYELEWSWTAQTALDAFSRAARIPLPEDVVRVEGPSTTHYRRRTRMSIDKDGQVGFLREKSHEVLSVDECLVAHPVLLAARDELLPVLSRCEGSVLLDLDADELSVVAFWQCKADLEDATQWLSEVVPGLHVRGVRVVPLKAYPSDKRRVDVGDVSFTQKTRGVAHTLTAGAFTQANQAINERLVQEVLESLSPGPESHVLELFCGAGNFSLSLLKAGAYLHGAEISREAIHLVRRAADKMLGADAKRARFSTLDLRKSLPERMSRPGSFTDVLLDPPRTGAKALIKDLIRLAPQRIVYVSCDPATLGRDVGRLVKDGGRKLDRLVVLDMFPRTWHVEMVAVLS